MHEKVAGLLLSLAAALGTAFAQAPQAPSTTQTPAVTPSPSGSPTAAQGTMGTKQAQSPDEHRSSKVLGLSVYNNSGDRIGTIDDLIITPQGQVATAVIGVGGFLGVGEKNVAVDFGSLRFTKDSRGNLEAKLDTTKDALKAAPAFTYHRAS